MKHLLPYTVSSVNFNKDGTVTAELKHNFHNRMLGLFYRTRPEAIYFDNAFRDALTESLKEPKTIEKHFEIAREYAKTIHNVTVEEIGFNEKEAMERFLTKLNQ